MRIALPIHSFEPGGVERVALRLAMRWRADGYDVPVILGRDKGTTREEAPALDYRIRPEPFSTARWETIWMIWCLYRFLKREQVDVLFCPGNTYTIVCVAMKLLLGKRCPPVLVKISNDLVRPDLPAIARPFYRLWVRIQGRFLDRFVALGEPMLPQLIEELGIDPSRARIIPDPALTRSEIEEAQNRSAAGPREGREFVAIARLTPQKNIPLLIDSFARIASPGDRLRIAGDGNDRARIEKRIARHQAGKQIELLGHVDNAAHLLADADALVLSSDYEGVPAVVLEALAAGVPVASTDCCISMDWLLGEGDHGVLARKGDPHALGQAMEKAARMKAPKDKMREFARSFTLEQSAETYLAAMQALVDGRAPPRSPSPSGRDTRGETKRTVPC